MNSVSIENQHDISGLKRFMALSRTSHGLLDMATPAVAAILWLGAFPPVEIIALGLITAFAGYTAVYALNDLVDYRVDREKVRRIGIQHSKSDLDAVYLRHPLAHGLLDLREALLWAGGWALVAMAGAYVLNPVCALIFVLASLLEAIYCLLLRITHLRVIVSGAVKTSGGIAAIFAVDSHPAPWFLILLFLWLFFWEVGGQNTPNDWADLQEDKQLQAKTLPVRFGPKRSLIIIFASLCLTLLMGTALCGFSSVGSGPVLLVGAFLAGFYTLLMPAYRLCKTQAHQQATALFNRASYYPFAMLIVVLIGLML